MAPENKAAENTGPEKEKAAPKKKKPAKMTRQQEIDRSVDRGTVPARYRNSIPKSIISIFRSISSRTRRDTPRESGRVNALPRQACALELRPRQVADMRPQ